MIIKSIRIEKLAYQGECRRLLLGGLPWANVVRSTKGDWRTCAEKEFLKQSFMNCPSNKICTAVHKDFRQFNSWSAERENS